MCDYTHAHTHVHTYMRAWLHTHTLYVDEKYELVFPTLWLLLIMGPYKQEGMGYPSKGTADCKHMQIWDSESKI